jgi:hypothetical protein
MRPNASSTQFTPSRHMYVWSVPVLLSRLQASASKMLPHQTDVQNCNKFCSFGYCWIQQSVFIQLFSFSCNCIIVLLHWCTDVITEQHVSTYTNIIMFTLYTWFTWVSALFDTHYSSRGSSVSIVTDYGLDDRGSIPDRGRWFFF